MRFDSKQTHAEMLKVGGETTVTVLKPIIDRIWENGQWRVATRLGNLRIDHHTESFRNCRIWTASALSHMQQKVTLEIIRTRIQYYLEPHIADEQFGFVPGKGTTETIITLRNSLKKVLKGRMHGYG